MVVINLCLAGHSTKYNLTDLSESAKQRAFETWRCPVCKEKLQGITVKEGML